MYVPEAFRVDDPEILADVMRRHSFATVVCADGEGVLATHLPLVYDAGRHALFGHFAKANAHWKSFETPRKTLAVFAGPHAYVSPSMYVTTPNVPTWAYVAVHAHGTPRLLDLEEAVRQMVAMVEYFDPHLSKAHPESAEIEYVRQKARGIVAFEMPIERLEGKFKVGQNKTEADRLGAAKSLLASQDPMDREIGRLYAEGPAAAP